jgi:hypothetical protein
VAQCKHGRRRRFSPWIERRVCGIVGLEAIESSVCEVVRGKGIIPTATNEPLGPDIIGMEKVEDTDQELSRQVVEGVTCVGYQGLDESLFTSPE